MLCRWSRCCRRTLGAALVVPPPASRARRSTARAEAETVPENPRSPIPVLPLHGALQVQPPRDRFADILGGEVVHEAGTEPPLRRPVGAGEQRGRSVLAAGEARGRSVLGALQPGAPVAPPPLGALQPPGAAAAAYLSAARYVTGSRIDTSLFRPLPMRTHRETTTVGSGAPRVDWAAKYLR